MKSFAFRFFVFICLLLFLSGCASLSPVIPVDNRSVNPGGKITRGGATSFDLLGTPVAVGQKIPSVNLISRTLKSVDLVELKGEVLVLSIVPSLDTQVCERQTHLLGEAAKSLPEGIRVLTISRDLPFAQNRFADRTGFKDILYLSDYQNADFGRGTGLLIDKIYLLARAIFVVDREGTIRYLQVVPELSHLPDMDEALRFAKGLLATGI